VRAISLGDLLCEPDEPHDITADEARLLAAVLAQRNDRTKPRQERASASSAADQLLGVPRTEPIRWPVIRTGEREPISWLTRLSVYRRDGFTCKICGYRPPDEQTTSHLELDHCIPWSAGGPDDSDNLRTLCSACNHRRSNWIDHAHAANYRPTTWWCGECWGTEAKARPLWRDGTDLCRIPRIYPDADTEPFELVFCAWCRQYNYSPIYLVGAHGRALIAAAEAARRPREDN